MGLAEQYVMNVILVWGTQNNIDMHFQEHRGIRGDSGLNVVSLDKVNCLY